MGGVSANRGVCRDIIGSQINVCAREVPAQLFDKGVEVPVTLAGHVDQPASIRCGETCISQLAIVCVGEGIRWHKGPHCPDAEATGQGCRGHSTPQL